jgi:hypothetical protein
VNQQACSCGKGEPTCSCGKGQPPQLVFALGALWFDFGTEARYDALVQQLGDPVRANNPAELFAFLRENPQYATGITFILMQEQIPLYAIQPAGPFALLIDNAIFDALESSLDATRNREQRVSIPGLIVGSTRLLNGMTIPVVYPDLRGMYKWQSHELIAAAKAAVGADVASDDHIFNFSTSSIASITRSAISVSLRKTALSISRRQTLIRHKSPSPKAPDEISSWIRSTSSRARSAGPTPIAGMSNCRCSIRRPSAAPTGSTDTPST